MNKRPDFVFEIDADELTLIIAESCLGIKRPPEESNKQILALLEAEEPDMVLGFRKAARNTAEYLAKCIRGSRRT